MRWKILWLTALLVSTTTAHQSSQDLQTIEHEPLELNPGIKTKSPENFDEKNNTSSTKPTENSTESSDENATTVKDDGTTTTESSSSEEIEATTPVTDTSQGPVDPIDQNDLIVETKSGLIQGHRWQGKQNIISYIDIPYGAVDQHFQPALPAKSWGQTIHDVKDHNRRCPQLDKDDKYVGNLDCLSLSIFKPNEAVNASVLFYIHGEDFKNGSGDPSIYGPEYLVSNGIILVLPNYRLGPLGFLCTHTNTTPGNIGLKDLTLALTWVKENIDAFGGDPDNIAVSGDGNSGALAGYLALSPMSKGYVNKVIAESGSFLSYWALDRKYNATAAAFFDNLTGNISQPIDIIFNHYNVQSIVEAGKGMEFKPCVEANAEGAFLVEAPHVTITTEPFDNITFLLGSAMYAGIHEALHHTNDTIKKLNEDPTLLLPNDLKFSKAAFRNTAGLRVKELYFGAEAITLSDKHNLSLCYTDIGYLGPGLRSARLLAAANATVYFYEFAYVGKINRVLESLGRPVEGAVKGDIVGYLFTQDSIEVDETNESEDGKMVITLVKMWTDFLKTGIPAPNWKKLEITDADKEEWLLIDTQQTMQKGLHVDRMALWTEIYDKYFIDNEGNLLSPSMYLVLLIQLVFCFRFRRNGGHIY